MISIRIVQLNLTYITALMPLNCWKNISPKLISIVFLAEVCLIASRKFNDWRISSSLCKSAISEDVSKSKPRNRLSDWTASSSLLLMIWNKVNFISCTINIFSWWNSRDKSAIRDKERCKCQTRWEWFRRWCLWSSELQQIPKHTQARYRLWSSAGAANPKRLELTSQQFRRSKPRRSETAEFVNSSRNYCCAIRHLNMMIQYIPDRRHKPRHMRLQWKLDRQSTSQD